MTAMAQNSELMLFVTHVESDGPFLKIWGQVDRNAATCVERMILPLSEKFAQGLGLPNPNFSLQLNTTCCARFQNEGYYRAKVCNIQPNGDVLVHFVDYGNFEVLKPSAIRLLDNIPGAVSLHALPPLAHNFILANVMPVNGAWDGETIESIKQTLRYADLKGMLHSVIGSYKLLKLCYNNEDFGELLVSKNLAVGVSLQDMFSRRQPPQNRAPHFPRENIAAVSGYSPRAQPVQNPQQEDWRSSQHRQTPSHVPEALVFKSRVLDVGSFHDVYVSYVEDGPLKFAVQVQSTSAILKQLMSEINMYPTAPLQEPPLPGSVCLGRYSLDGVLCRAVVMAVMEQKCKVYYVDFGHTEVLPYSDIFQLPPQYINPRVLSIRFTLSGLKDVVITEATKEYFKKIVTGKPLLLQVRPPEGPPLIQYGDLYENGINIRDVIKETCGVPAPVFYQDTPRLKRGHKDLVHVSFVESCSKFFIQLDSGVKSLNSVMACLAEYAKNAPQLEQKNLQVGWPCCASYGEDKQWYRAQILGVKGDQVTVLYVDYGNEEVVSSSALRKIHNDLVTNLRTQAIRCALNGFQSSIFNQELANRFELIVLEKKLAMEVVDVLPNTSVVELLDCTVVPMVSISSKLQFPSPSTRSANSNSSINAHREGEQVLNSSRSPDQKYQSEDRNSKWGKSGKPNTWGQETRSNEWSARARNNNHEDKERLDEKTRPKIMKDVENEQRQRDNNRHDGEDRLHQKETRNNYFNRNESGANRHERNDESGSRRGRGNRFGSGPGISREDNRFDKNTSKDDSWSDRDSDTSSRSSGKRGSKGPRGIKGRTDRGGRRGGGDRKPTSGKWSDGDSDRSSQKSTQSSGFKSRDRNSPNPSSKNAKTQPNKTGTWNSMSPTSPVKETPRVQKFRIPPPNITVGAVKNSEVTYTDSPTDFYVQLCPDNVELDALMEKIALKYNNGGTIIKNSDIQPGMSCIAQYSCDSKWYRAIIKAKSAENATVHFIDYGNTETVGRDQIKELLSEFAKLSAQAVHCKLFGAIKSSWTDEEIDSFSQAAEGVPLEAEFVSQENGVYEVLLKPVEDNSSDPNYVNKKFCGNMDLIQAKQDVRNKARGGRKKAREIPQYIPTGQKWNDESFAPGFQVDVVVTWFVNPNNFYCQILSKQSEFRTMMNNIQESYSEQQPIKNTLQVGAPVIAFFSDDGALYRAEIKELNKLRGHIVQYVDFGNCAMVDPCKIYPVEKRFALLPKQAMHCSLRNVSPAAGIDWSKANKHEIDKYFDADKYKCTFHGTKDGKYIISLCDNGKDIGDTMIAAGLAANPEASVKAVVNKDTSAKEKPVSNDTEKQDLTLWNGQTIRTTVSNVQGAAKFYIQLPTTIESKKIVENLKNSTTADHAGSKNHLVECHLFNVTPTLQVDDVLKKSIEGKDAIVKVKNVNNQRFAVELYDASGKKVKLVETDKDDSISPICPLPVLNLTEKVWVTHIESAEKIWLQRSSDSDNIAELLSSLYEYYSESGTPLVAEVGTLCVVESKDKNWYRAMVQNLKESEAEVRFIDYGNSEEVALTGIKALEQQFYVPHQMAIEVSLIVKLKGTEEEQKTILHENFDDKELTATFHNVNNKWLVELTESDKKISETLSALNLVAEFKEMEPQQLEIPEIIVGNRYEVFLSHSDSPAQFWLQRNEEIEAIEVMQANLQAAAPNFAPTTGIPEEGTLCAALYSADGMWYRAEVLDADEDITTVRFIDYGNADIIDSNSKNIKELPQSWKSIKKYGLKSRLDLIPTGSEDWSTASCEMFENMATSTNSPITALVIADSVPRRVELFVNENSIGDALVKEGHAIMVHNAEDLIDEIIDVEFDPRSAFVSHVNSPSEFWVQEEKSVSDLEIMTDRFIVADMFPKLDNISEGTLCVAKFPDDDQWYRARAKSHSTSGTEVLYIDYGNSAVSTEVRTIPEDLAAIAPLSRKCCLQLPPGVKEWSAEACDKFVDLAADGATIFLLDVLKEGETSIVSLTLDGVNVADELTQLCDVLAVIDERLPPLGEENSPNVVVSHVNSPSEFWTQAESSIGELEIMASRLVDAQSLLPLNTFEEGTICAAKFPEDGQWYRAKILSHGESGTNVLYFDYGNSASTTELRILPEDVANIPSLATRCTLSLPKDVESWSEEASTKFNELVADGETMFQFEILDGNDPTLIALQLEGKDVVDLLKPLCKLKVSTEEVDKEIIEPLTMMKIDSTIKEQRETLIIESSENMTKVSEESTINDAGNVQISGSDNLCKVETDKLDVPEVKEALTNGSDHACEIEQAETDKPDISTAETVHGSETAEIEQAETEKPDVSMAETGQINTPDNVCKTEQAKTDILDIPEAEEVPDTKKTSITDDLVLEEKTTAEISEPLDSIVKTESPDPEVNNVSEELILPAKLSAENLLDKPAAEDDSKLSATTEPESISVEVKKEIEAPIELSVDDIVGNMVKVALVDGADQIKVEEDITEEMHQEKAIVDETEKPEELPEGVTKDCTAIVDGTEKPEELSEDVTKECVVSTPQKTPKMDKIVPGSISRGSMEEDIPPSVLGRRRSSCSDDRIVPGGINKGNDLTEAEIVDLLPEENRGVSSSQLPVELKKQPLPVTPGKTQREEKIVPGSISRGESPTIEPSRPSTPKTPHSEKLLAGVVNLQENLTEDEEPDEILTVEV